MVGELDPRVGQRYYEGERLVIKVGEEQSHLCVCIHTNAVLQGIFMSGFTDDWLDNIKTMRD